MGGMMELTDGNVADFKRSLDMIEGTLTLCQTFFERQSEAAAAQHASTKVMYSPICVLLHDSCTKITALQLLLEEG